MDCASGFLEIMELWRTHAFEMTCRLYTRVIQQKYRKFPKYLDTKKFCCNHSKIWTMWLYHRVMSPNDADGMANSVDPDQTAPLGAVWSGSALFAQTCLSKNLGKLRYLILKLLWLHHYWATSRESLSSGFTTRSDSNRPAHPQKVGRAWNFGYRTRGIILSRQRTTKALIRLRRCAGWPASLLFAYAINRFSYDVPHLSWLRSNRASWW